MGSVNVFQWWMFLLTSCASQLSPENAKSYDALMKVLSVYSYSDTIIPRYLKNFKHISIAQKIPCIDGCFANDLSSKVYLG